MYNLIVRPAFATESATYLRALAIGPTDNFVEILFSWVWSNQVTCRIGRYAFNFRVDSIRPIILVGLYPDQSGDREQVPILTYKNNHLKFIVSVIFEMDRTIEAHSEILPTHTNGFFRRMSNNRKNEVRHRLLGRNSDNMAV